MAPRPLLTLAVLASLVCAPACTKTRGPGSQTPELTAPATIADLDDYAAARNAYALLSLDDPKREGARKQLRDYLLGYVGHALERKQLDSAIDGLEQLAGLWMAAELRSLASDPELARVAERAYAAAATTGDERPAMLAVGLTQAFGDATQRSAAERHYAEIVDWIARTEPYADDPRVLVELDSLLEDITALLPTPYLVQRLADFYLHRYRDAQRKGTAFGTGDPRIPYTGYLLARLYLRADDLQAAVAALDRIPADESTASLRNLIADAEQPDASASVAQLIFEFLPTPEDRLPPEIVAQSWGIVDNLAQRSLAKDRNDPPANLTRGRVLRARNHVDAAIVHYERALAVKGPRNGGGTVRAAPREDLFRAWVELAELYQLALESRAELDVGLDDLLARVEAFHVRAIETWPQRPIDPGVTLAWMTVALAEFNAGHIDRAQELMQQTIAVEPQPAALSLLGKIALRRGALEDARGYMSRLAKLSDRLPDQLDRYNWQISSKIGLAEIETFAGEREAGRTQLREALRQLNTLLSYPGLDNALRAEFALRRAGVFFLLGELALGMDDAREAQQLAPERSDTFSEPLVYTVVHGHYHEAIELLDAALARPQLDELNVYFCLWVLDLAARQGEDVPERAREHLRKYAANADAPAWQRQLARFGLGELGEGQLGKQASSARERSEALFYEGLAQWRRGSTAASLELMRKVLEQQMMSDFEFEMAQSYVRFNELPKSVRTDP